MGDGSGTAGEAALRVNARSVDFGDEAGAELEEAALRYRERDATLPDRLLARVDATVTAIA